MSDKITISLIKSILRSITERMYAMREAMECIAQEMEKARDAKFDKRKVNLSIKPGDIALIYKLNKNGGVSGKGVYTCCSSYQYSYDGYPTVKEAKEAAKEYARNQTDTSCYSFRSRFLSQWATAQVHRFESLATDAILADDAKRKHLFETLRKDADSLFGSDKEKLVKSLHAEFLKDPNKYKCQ